MLVIMVTTIRVTQVTIIIMMRIRPSTKNNKHNANIVNMDISINVNKHNPKTTKNNNSSNKDR